MTPSFEDEPVRAAPPRARSVSESTIVAGIVRHIKGLTGAHAMKVHGGAFGHVGEPDIDACVNGRSVKIEVKRPGYEPTDAQFGALRRWQAAGALVGWACSRADAEQLLAYADRRSWVNPLTGPGAPPPEGHTDTEVTARVRQGVPTAPPYTLDWRNVAAGRVPLSHPGFDTHADEDQKQPPTT